MDDRNGFERECLSTILKDASMLVQEERVPVVGVAFLRRGPTSVLTIEVQVDTGERIRLKRNVWPSDLSGDFMASTLGAALVEWWEVGRHRGHYIEEDSEIVI